MHKKQKKKKRNYKNLPRVFFPLRYIVCEPQNVAFLIGVSKQTWPLSSEFVDMFLLYVLL